MSEEAPLYGEQKKSTKVFLLVIQGLVGFFVAFSIIIGIVFGIKRHEGQHVMLVFVLVDLAICSFILFRWYNKDSLEGKYRWLLIAFVATLIWACITMNAYAWKKPHVDPASLCNGGNGLYVFQTKSCVTLTSSGGLNACVGKGVCLCLSGHNGNNWSGYCTNCTANPCAGIALPTPPPRPSPSA